MLLVSFFVVLDACVLYPFALRDTLLRFAEQELYDPLWSDAILDEMERNLITKAHIPIPTVREMRSAMQQAFAGACVPRPSIQGIEGAMRNHPNDRHVLATAVASAAEVLVTANLRDFPVEATRPHGVDVQSPDEFLVGLFDLDGQRAADIVRKQAEDLLRPPVPVEELLGYLTRAGVPRFVSAVRAHL